MKIDRANMRVQVSIPHKEAKIVHDRLKSLFKTIEVEDWEAGNLVMVSFWWRVKLLQKEKGTI